MDSRPGQSITAHSRERVTSGDYPTEVSFNVETKLECFPDLHLLVWVNVGEEDVRIIRLQ